MIFTRNKEFENWLKEVRSRGFFPKPEHLYTQGRIQLNEHEDDIYYENVFDWMEAAAEEGHTEAMAYLAEFYEYGKGVEKDFAKAYEWGMKSVEGDPVGEICALSHFYEVGINVERDPEKAFEYLQKAAKLGAMGAQDELANHYRKAGKTRDSIFLYNYWYKRWKNNPGSEALLALRKMGGMKFSSAVDELLKRGLKLDGAGYFEQGLIVSDKEEKDYADAFCWFEAAAKEGHNDAMIYTANYYKDGKGVEKNLEKALEWYTKAAIKDDDVCLIVAEMHENGIGTPKNTDLAALLYRQAAFCGNPLAAIWLDRNGITH